MRQYVVSLAAIVAILGAFGNSLAQNSDASASYEPAYFTQFQPNTARDMVGRIPGFTLQGGGGGARGFGQANLNILINGRRPSSKSSNANDILGRIPADNVERIDIVDGASLDIPGLSGQVANIISNAGKLSGNWRYSARFEEGTQPQVLEGEVSISGARGNLEYVASFEAGQFTTTEDGVEQFFDGNNNLFEDRIEDIRFNGNRPNVDLNLTYTPKDNHIANLNLSGSLFNRNRNATEDSVAVDVLQSLQPQIPQTGNTGQTIFDSGEDEYKYEVGGDYAFPLGGGSLKIIGLHNYENSDSTSVFQEFNIGTTPSQSRFDSVVKEGEFIGRTEYNWKTGTAHDWQVSWEGAFNYLDSTTETSNSTSLLTVTPIAVENVRVEEQRTEANLTHSWALSEKLNFQTSLGAEYSRLDVTTGEEPARTFFRPKGFLSASYSYSPTYIWRARVERGVDQLNFGIFASSVNLADDIATGGNTQIIPTQFWNGEVELERIDSKALSGKVKVFARRFEDPIDSLLFDNGTIGPGNLDSAWLYGVEANTTWLLDNIGLKGMRLELEGQLRGSNIDDPIIGQSRNINDIIKWQYRADIIHDIPNSPWAWSANIRRFKQSPFFRVDQSFQAIFVRPRLDVSVTHKDFFGTKFTARLQNILDLPLTQERLIFNEDRSGELLERQFFSRKRGLRFGITIEDTF